MRALALVIPVLMVAFFSCNGPDSDGPSGGELLTTTSYTIDPAKDTVLKTPGGALLKIGAGTFDAGDAAAVRLEVKEAYTSDEISKGKLSDRLRDEALNSNGIIYVNLAAGQSVSIRRPITVSIPARSIQKDMQVYKGQLDQGGEVVWSEPRSLDDNPGLRQLDHGQAIYMTNCAACHKLRGDLHGPSLAFLAFRRDRQWLYDFTRNNARMLWRGDPYACFLFNRYGKTVMPLYPDLNDTDLDAVFQYVTSASKSLGLDSNAVVDHKASFDSCAKNDPNCAGAIQRIEAMHGSDTTARPVIADIENYYSFPIDRHGWYNVAVKGEGEKMTVDSTAAGSGEMTGPLESCPCWCDVSAYRKADSVARANGR
ncbi:MAG TPA: cytochrome c [Puia sp.]|nr:cytochrome c [Puia sp.]